VKNITSKDLSPPPAKKIKKPDVSCELSEVVKELHTKSQFFSAKIKKANKTTRRSTIAHAVLKEGKRANVVIF